MKKLFSFVIGGGLALAAVLPAMNLSDEFKLVDIKSGPVLSREGKKDKNFNTSVFIDEVTHNGGGGKIIARVDHGKKQGGMEKMVISWTFSKDVSTLRADETFRARLHIDSNGGPKSRTSYAILAGHRSRVIYYFRGREDEPKPQIDTRGTTDRVYAPGHFDSKKSKGKNIGDGSAEITFQDIGDNRYALFNIKLSLYSAKGQASYEVVYIYDRQGQVKKDDVWYKGDTGRINLDHDAHYDWAKGKSKAKVKTELLKKTALLMDHSSISLEEAAALFADISVIIPRYISDASVFGGDKGVLDTSRAAHLSWARKQKNKAAILKNLDWKVGRTITALSGDKAAQFYADVSLVLAKYGR